MVAAAAAQVVSRDSEDSGSGGGGGGEGVGQVDDSSSPVRETAVVPGKAQAKAPAAAKAAAMAAAALNDTRSVSDGGIKSGMYVHIYCS